MSIKVKHTICFLAVIFTLLSVNPLFASEIVDNIDEEEEIFDTVEEPAQFPGGQNALNRWISDNLQYPESAKKNDIQGRVIVKFVVEKDGSNTSAEIDRSVDKDLDQEALRIVSIMPKWKPATIWGEPVRSYYKLTVTFRNTNN
ncbi:MAG: energy transducer TonB [Muribaculaceae bacterium]|nr:energy transducer TonB [Muribaculaceae bacterium]